MRILFLDDDETRHNAFKMVNIGHNVTHVRTAKECIAVLKNNPVYDLVSLDHDLGGEVYTTKEEGSGYEVAKFIRNELDDKKKPLRVIVHSYNSIGAKRMVETIWDAGISVAWRRFGT